MTTGLSGAKLGMGPEGLEFGEVECYATVEDQDQPVIFDDEPRNPASKAPRKGGDSSEGRQGD